MNPPRHTVLDRDPNDEWALVELYRWQHGKLPPLNQTGKPFDSAQGFAAMAARIERGPGPDEFPTPDNVASVLRYAASRIRSDRELARRLLDAFTKFSRCESAEDFDSLKLEITACVREEVARDEMSDALRTLIETRPLVEGMR